MKSGSQLDRHPGAAQQLGESLAAASARAAPAAASVRSRTQPSGCVSAENHTTPGTTVDDGQSGRTRSTCSTPFCSTHTTVCSSHSRASQPAACVVLGVLDGQQHHVDRAVDLGGIGVHRAGHARSDRASSGRTSIDVARGVRPHSRTG